MLMYIGRFGGFPGSTHTFKVYEKATKKRTNFPTRLYREFFILMNLICICPYLFPMERLLACV